jgi:hypothetical protein
MMIAGPLADRVFEPAMRSGNGFLPAAFGWIAGTGPGAGMAVMFLVAGLCIILVSLIAYAVPSIRNIESLLPDHTTGSPAVPRDSGWRCARDTAGRPGSLRMLCQLQTFHPCFICPG